MAGIVSYGAYIPKWRMNRELIAKGLRGEKAICGPDEDSVTMAVAAVLDCLNGVDRQSIEGLFFASTTSPYKEKQIATIVAAAADFRPDIITADFANSLRAGTSALRAANDAVKAGSARKVMVVAADSRLGSPWASRAPGAGIEPACGDGAAALLIGEDNVAASLEASYSISNELMDIWRAEEDIYVRAWEDRFIRTQGYLKIPPKAIQGLLSKTKLSPKDISKLILAMDPGVGPGLARGLGFDPKTQLQDSLYDLVGNTGTAYSLMLLVAALEEVKAGDNLLVASYGNGSDALLFKVNEQIEKIRNHRGIKKHLESKRQVPDYATYLRWRGLVRILPPLRIHHITMPSPPPLMREQERIYPLNGVKCKNCGTIQFPPQRVCTKCQAKDNFEPIRLCDKRGKIFSFSSDFFWEDFKALVNFEGGGRMLCGVTDILSLDELEIDKEVEMNFRKQFYSGLDTGGIHNYYWKAIPVRA